MAIKDTLQEDFEDFEKPVADTRTHEDVLSTISSDPDDPNAPTMGEINESYPEIEARNFDEAADQGRKKYNQPMSLEERDANEAEQEAIDEATEQREADERASSRADMEQELETLSIREQIREREEREAEQRMAAEALAAQAIDRAKRARATAQPKPGRFNVMMEKMKASATRREIERRERGTRGITYNVDVLGRSWKKGTQVGPLSPKETEDAFSNINKIYEGAADARPISDREWSQLQPQLKITKEGRRLIKHRQRLENDFSRRLSMAVKTAESEEDIISLVRGIDSSEGQARSPRGAFENPKEEQAFQEWYAKIAQQTGLNADPDDPEQYYDYRRAWKGGAKPGPDGHWPSIYKAPDHPNRYVGGASKFIKAWATKQAADAIGAPTAGGTRSRGGGTLADKFAERREAARLQKVADEYNAGKDPEMPAAFVHKGKIVTPEASDAVKRQIKDRVANEKQEEKDAAYEALRREQWENSGSDESYQDWLANPRTVTWERDGEGNWAMGKPPTKEELAEIEEQENQQAIIDFRMGKLSSSNLTPQMVKLLKTYDLSDDSATYINDRDKITDARANATAESVDALAKANDYEYQEGDADLIQVDAGTSNERLIDGAVESYLNDEDGDLSKAVAAQVSKIKGYTKAGYETKFKQIYDACVEKLEGKVSSDSKRVRANMEQELDDAMKVVAEDTGAFKEATSTDDTKQGSAQAAGLTHASNNYDIHKAAVKSLTNSIFETSGYTLRVDAEVANAIDMLEDDATNPAIPAAVRDAYWERVRAYRAGVALMVATEQDAETKRRHNQMIVDNDRKVKTEELGTGVIPIFKPGSSEIEITFANDARGRDLKEQWENMSTEERAEVAEQEKARLAKIRQDEARELERSDAASRGMIAVWDKQGNKVEFDAGDMQEAKRFDSMDSEEQARYVGYKKAREAEFNAKRVQAQSLVTQMESGNIRIAEAYGKKSVPGRGDDALDFRDEIRFGTPVSEREWDEYYNYLQTEYGGHKNLMAELDKAYATAKAKWTVETLKANNIDTNSAQVIEDVLTLISTAETNYGVRKDPSRDTSQDVREAIVGPAEKARHKRYIAGGAREFRLHRDRASVQGMIEDEIRRLTGQNNG